MRPRLFSLALAATIAVGLPLAASAQPYPGGWHDNGRYDRRGGEMSGRITAFSPYNLDIAGAPHIRMHNGTVIYPTGIGLQPGMRVNVFGHRNGDGTFEADEIDVLNARGYDHRWDRY